MQEGFFAKDFIEITSDNPGSSDRLVVQLQDNFVKQSNVQSGSKDKKKIYVVSVMKVLIDAHPFLKAGSTVNVRTIV